MSQEQIRNFVIIAHIDHGKSTLADRFLELTKTVSEKKMKPQFLDMMDLERERGITIKLQPVRMDFEFSGSKYILNLVDTPGHVDFSYEVSRSLAAVEGAVLLVDAGQGIQAQTLANLDLAKQQKLVIIPVVNKIDLAQAKTDETVKELANLLEINSNEVIKISGKFGTNIDQLLEAIIKDIPPPQKSETENYQKSFRPVEEFRKDFSLEKSKRGEAIRNFSTGFRALIFDSEYDPYKGVIAYVRVVDGEIKIGEKIKLLATQIVTEVKELGYFKPEFSSQDKLSTGEIGYIATGIKEPGKVRVGDTVASGEKGIRVESLPDYQEPKPMVFASLYPENPDDFEVLKEALSKLKLNDPSLVSEPETKKALGRGFRCGFLGTLHAEIVSERLHREFGLNLVISSPSVVYKIINQQNEEELIYSATDWPDPSYINKTEELWVFLEIITPIKYTGRVLEILKNLGGSYIETKYFGFEKVILIYEIPLRGIIANLYDKIKGATQGYASMNYKILGFRAGDLVKMEVLIAEEKDEAFSKIISRESANREGRWLVEKLKETIPSQQFSVALQAVIGGKIVARETIKSRRKDVTDSLYGGDYSRKRKLLEKQKKGKLKLKGRGRVRIPPEVYLKIFRELP